ncbi:MAG TPA: RidA family protein [Verrucomicrobiae bacterium]|nr:RidA family protein [Verrucomicrobiae bacterium]
MIIVQPHGWPSPKGYSNGIIATGRFLAIAGQIGWNEQGEIVADDFTAQAAQSLRNVLAVVRAAGGDAEHIVRMTWYVTDKRAYLNASQTLGAVYRELLGTHFPAMTLVEVRSLLEDRARVEIEATAILP